MNVVVPERLRSRFGTRLKVNEPLAVHTSFRIGGPADLFISAKSREDIVDAIRDANLLGIPWTILGRGSNVLVDDLGIRGLVIRNEAVQMVLNREEGLVTADSGVRLPTLGAQTAKTGFAGLEWTVGIPGSVGGAVVMNAGAHGGCVADTLIQAEVLTGGERASRAVTALDYSYRTSRLQNERNVIVLGADFRITACDPREALDRIQSYRRHRQNTQPTDAGAGSIFRNPPGQSAGALIDRAGLKGTRRGGALISPKHGNFIVNIDHATAADVYWLIDYAREAVGTTFGISLQTEVEMIGPSGHLR